MNSLRVAAVSLLLGISALADPLPVSWFSPDQKLEVKITHTAENATPTIVSGPNGELKNVVESPFLASPIRREFGGTTWLAEAHPRWAENRYLIFETEDRLVIVDAASHSLVLDTVFEAKEKSPASDKWAAIRYRPYARKDGDLPVKADTFFLIDLPKVTTHAASPPENARPFQHLESIALPGRALTKPAWIGKNQDRLAIAIWNGERAQALMIGTSPLKIIDCKDLEISLPKEIIDSLWISPAIALEIISATVKVFPPAD